MEVSLFHFIAKLGTFGIGGQVVESYS